MMDDMQSRHYYLQLQTLFWEPCEAKSGFITRKISTVSDICPRFQILNG